MMMMPPSFFPGICFDVVSWEFFRQKKSAEGIVFLVASPDLYFMDLWILPSLV
jgi:hypothetical protein